MARKLGVMRTLSAYVTAFLLLASCLPRAGATETTGPFVGGGTLLDPYLISSLDDLRELRNRVDSGEDYSRQYFAQTEDLTFPDDENWNPIGALQNNLAFRGTYDGRGHVIRNIHCVNSHAGLFALMNGEVRNLGIESGRFEGSYIGSITSHGSGRIINCYNKAEVTGSERAGGLTDNFGGRIMFSWNLGAVSGSTETTVVAGLTSFGTGKIYYSYTTQPNPVSKDTFTGELTESRTVSASGISEILYTLHSLIESELPESILYGGVATMEYSRGNLSFSGYQSAEDRYLRVTENRYNFQGEGTQANPFLIQSLDDLKLMRDNVNYGVDYRGYFFAQTENIVFPDEINWTPIGSVSESVLFRGNYDGRGHVMENIRSNNQYASLFANLGGEVRNLGIASGRFQGDCVGSVASHGSGEGKIINCYNNAEVVAAGRGGGITDNFNGQILFCWNLGPVSASSQNAILAGISSFGGANIQYTYATTEPAVNSETFTGKIQESKSVNREQIPELLEKDYAAMALQDRRIFSRNNITFMLWQDDGLAFSDTVPTAYTMSIIKTYIPVATLCLTAVIVLTVMLLLRNKRNVQARKDATQANAEEGGQSDAI